MFNILHSSMLQSIASSYDYQNSEFNSKNESIVIMISNQLFEKEFNAQTPLDKNILNLIVKQILEEKPSKLIFDLDISPDFNFKTNKSLYTNDLYETLIKYSSSTNIILPFYFISETEKNTILKKNWLLNMCKNDISFGLPFIFKEIGSVLQYSETETHISFISKSKKNIICEDIVSNLDFNLQKKIDNYRYLSDKAPRYPINYRKINSSTIILNDLADLKKYKLENKTVFLGGSYGFDDKYLTPYGEKNGVEILNSIFYTLDHKVNKNNAILTLIIFDLLIGIVFGLFLDFLLKKRKILEHEKELIINNFLLLLLSIITYFISLSISAYLFHKMYVWINPVPILIGLFIAALLNIISSDREIKRYNISVLKIINLIIILAGLYGFVNSF